MSSTLLPPDSEQTVTTADGHDTQASLPFIPSELGRYVVLEQIGAGGMGVVVRAYDPKLRREVAIKQLRSDALDQRGAERMVREAQAMAQLAHPNVVAVHDVEELASTVLLVMEYVEGRTLRAWLRDGEPPWERVLEIFIQAGRGLAAAHEAGLVHRDFKPDNVLVGRDGRVRVTDFGLARAAHDVLPIPSVRGIESISSSHDSLSARMTVDGEVMGTPVYMAPEQHLAEEAGASADQFSFCVALWEALAGVRPYSGEFRAIAKAKLRGPPAWPQKSPVPREVAEAAARGLAPDPSDRWPSMVELLAVLDRDRGRGRLHWIAGGAVTVAAVATATAVLGWSGQGAEVCTGAREHLQQVWGERRRAEVTESLRATGVEYAEETSEQVGRVLDAYAEAWVSMHTQACEATSVRAEQSAAVLDLRMACLDRLRNRLDATVDVLTDADAMVVERAVSLATGLPPVSRCADVDALRDRDVGPEDPQLAQAVEDAERRLDRARIQREAGHHQEALAMVDAVEPDALAYPPLRVAAATERGHGLLALGRYDESEQVLGEVYPVAIRTGQHASSVECVSLLAFVVGARKLREQEARWLGQTALSMAERLDEPRLIAVARNDLGAVLETHAHFAEALAQLEQVLEIQRELHGDGPSLPVATTLANLALASRRSGDFERSLELRTQEHAMVLELLGDQHPEAARSMQAMGHVLHLRGEYAESLDYLERALEVRRRVLGPEHPETANVMGSLGITPTAVGRHAEAERQLRASLALLEGSVGADTLEVIDTLTNLAIAVDAQGRYEESLALHRRARELLERTMGPEHPRTAAAINNVGGALIALRRAEEALPLLRRSVELMKALPGPPHPHLAVFEFNVGDALFRLGRYDEAEPLLRRTLETMEEVYGAEHVYLSYPMVALGQLLHARGQDGDRARALLERGLELREAAPDTDPKRAEAAFALARVLGDEASQRARARILAQQAHAQFSGAGPGHRIDRDEVEAWLQAHPAR